MEHTADDQQKLDSYVSEKTKKKKKKNQTDNKTVLLFWSW